MKSNSKIHDLQSLKNHLSKSKKIGLFGGSFNPAHIGHLEISKYAIHYANLDYIIWLVAPQNPLKSPYKKTIEDRAKYAQSIIDNNQILVSTMEQEIKSNNSFETIEFFCNSFPKIDFTWIMGVDCLKDFHLWENYNKFTDLVDMLIFDRPGYSDYINNTISIKELLKNPKHSVVFCQDKMIDISSTEIRAKQND